MKRTLTMMMISAVVLLSFCGCRKAPAVVIDPVENTNTTTTSAVKQEEQVFDENLVFTDLIMFNSTSLKWSWLKPYLHQLTSETTATFAVESTNDPSIQATLFVTFDEATNTVSQADVTFNGVTASVLTDNDLDLYTVLREMVEAEKE